MASAAPMPAVSPPPPVTDMTPQPAEGEAPAPEAHPAHQSFFARLFGGGSSTPPSDNQPPWKQHGPLSASSETAATEDKENMPEWADHWVGKGKEGTKEAAADKNAAPSLSSVPATPAQFKDIRAEKQQSMQELQNDQAMAQQQKNALNSEPSQQQQQNITPVEMPAKAESEPQPQQGTVLGHMAAPPQDQVPPSRSSGTPRRGVDIMTQEQWEAFEKARKDTPYTPLPQAAAPSQSPAPEPGTPAPNYSSPRQNYWNNQKPALAPDQEANPAAGPQSSVETPAEPVATADPPDKDANEFAENIPAPETKPVQTASSEPSKDSSSFFSRLFGTSDKQAATDNAQPTSNEPKQGVKA